MNKPPKKISSLIAATLLSINTVVAEAPLEAGYYNDDNGASSYVYEGDIIPEGVSYSLGIQFFCEERADGSLIVKVKNDWLKTFDEFLGGVLAQGELTESDFISIYSRERNPLSSSTVLKLQPNNGATVLSNQETTFSWGKLAHEFIITDVNQKPVFQKLFDKAQKDFSVTPHKIGLIPGQTYFWQVDDSNRKYKIKVLDKNTEETIKEHFKKINFRINKSDNTNDLILAKALYLQIISDTNPKINLYWLSYQLLNQAEEETDAKLFSVMSGVQKRAYRYLNLQTNLNNN